MAAAPNAAEEAEIAQVKDLRLGQLLTEWGTLIGAQRAAFQESGNHIVEWDGLLRRARVDLFQMEAHVAELEARCDDIDSGLGEMETSQSAMDAKLARLEGKLAELLPRDPSTQTEVGQTGTYAAAAQLARAQAYDAALQLGTLLDELETVLDDVEKQVEEGQAGDGANPVRAGAGRRSAAHLMFFGLPISSLSSLPPLRHTPPRRLCSCGRSCTRTCAACSRWPWAQRASRSRRATSGSRRASFPAS